MALEVSAATVESPATDPTVALLVATAVGFVEAGIHTGAITRLRDFANGDADMLDRARAMMHLWPYLSPDARAGALRLLTAAARR